MGYQGGLWYALGGMEALWGLSVSLGSWGLSALEFRT